MLRLRRFALLALLTAVLLPLGTARADTSGGAGYRLIHSTAASGGADAGTPPRARPRRRKHRAKPKRHRAARKHHRAAPRHHRAKPKARPKPRPRPAPRSGVFPVRGSFTFGGSDARFGAGRRGHIHQGQDVVAAEGTPLVSPVPGIVLYRAYQAGGAGNYVVIHGRDRRDYVLMHLRHRALVAPGASVHAGQSVGVVGHTGDASGPHLHFEIWVGGWQSGGHPVDPLPYLRRWR